METAWITGASGFCGRYVAEHLSRDPEAPLVVGLDRTEPPASLRVSEFVRLDLTRPEEVAAAARRIPPTWVIHLAGLTHATEAELWHANVGAALAVGLGLAAAGCRATRVLGIGSAAEYGADGPDPIGERVTAAPVGPYGRAKLAQTLLTIGFCRTLGISACVARAFNIIGPGQSDAFVLGRLCREFTRVPPDGEITLRNLDSSRDFVDVRDAAAAYWRLVRTGRAGEIYNVCSGTTVSVRELVGHLSTATGKHPVVHTSEQPGDVSAPAVVVGSFDKLRADTGWAPAIPLAATIRDMLAEASSGV